MNATDLLRFVADPTRLAVLGTLAIGPRTTADLAKAVGAAEREVRVALAPLVQAGIVVTDDGVHGLVVPRLRAVTGAGSHGPAPLAPEVGYGLTDEERRVIAPFFDGERLRSIPAGRAKRLVLLTRLALEFEVGRRYPEAQVNAMLARFHDDYASLRRYLVDEGFMQRSDGEYWRSGGRVPVDDRTLAKESWDE